MTKGVFLIAFGNPCYGRAAYNLAVSIKYFDKDLPICLLHDSRAFERGKFPLEVFDIKIPLNEVDISSPASIKTSIYDLLPFDYNLYLDVDALCLKPLNPLFDDLIQRGGDYYVFVNEVYDKDSPDVMPMMFWAERSVIWNHYGLNGEKLPATQSSIQFIKKGEVCERLFKQVNKNLQNPIPISDLRNQWGGTQPDELYLNVALAQLGMNPSIGDGIIFFANQIDPRPLVKLRESFYILSLFGGKSYTRGIYKTWYDKLLINYFKAFGQNHSFKSNFILGGKHADRKTGNAMVNGSVKRVYNKPKISIALTNFNRKEIINSVAEVLNDERISEVVISDDCSTDDVYNYVENFYKDNKKVKLFRNETNIGMSLNKKRAVELCSGDWAILFDSDNILTKIYLDRLYFQPVWKENTIYAPEAALPNFNFRSFVGIEFGRNNIRQFLKKRNFEVMLNTCNYFVNRKQYLKTHRYDESIKGSDSIQFMYEWFKGGNLFRVVPRMTYTHAVHDGSEWLKHADYNLKKAEETSRLIMEL